jgi:hypothetical protein
MLFYLIVTGHCLELRFCAFCALGHGGSAGALESERAGRSIWGAAARGGFHSRGVYLHRCRGRTAAACGFRGRGEGGRQLQSCAVVCAHLVAFGGRLGYVRRTSMDRASRTRLLTLAFALITHVYGLN